MMNCKKVKILLPAYAAGELSESERTQVAEHLDGCDDCRSVLAGYASIGTRLAVLETIPVNTDILDSTISRIKATGINWHFKLGWPRFAFMGAAAIILVFIMTTILALPVQTPRDMLAQALTNTRNLNSFRVYTTDEITKPITYEWVVSHYVEAEYSGAGNIHEKQGYSDYYFRHDLYHNPDAWIYEESIIKDQTIYLFERTDPYTQEIEDINQGWADQTVRLQQSIDSFSQMPLVDVKKLPDEEIDGTMCFYYKSMVDMDAFIDKLLVIVEKVCRTLNATYPGRYEWTEERANHYIHYYQARQIEVEAWVGQEDQFIHQYRSTTINIGDASSILNNTRSTTRYYDFNKEIIITSPLDSAGNLLPGWKIQESVDTALPD
jgi:hypothetical protein